MSDSQDDSRQKPLTPNRSYQPTFAAGELSPSLWWRSDQAKWRAGAAQLYNWIVTAQGGVARRAGTQFVGLAKGTNAEQRLIPFQFSTEQQYIIEVGNLYMRFYSNGAPVMSGGVPYEIATPYGFLDLFSIRFVQSADVLTLVHPLYAPMELRRLGSANWTLVPMQIGTTLPAPGGVTAVAMNAGAVGGSPAPSTLGFVYAVTASKFGANDESALSTSAACANQDLGYYSQYGVYNQIGWATVAGADFYTVYRYYQGVWAKVASTVQLSLDDINYLPDTTKGPPQASNPFASGNYPGTVGYFQERRVFGGSNANPETIWMSKSGNYTNFDVSNPSLADDAITYTLAARQVNQIRHLIPLSDLILFTGGGGWRMSGQNGPVTPSSIDVAPQTFVGCSTVEPLVIGNRILFVEAKGSSIREVAYQFVQNQYVSEDRSVYSSHLFKGHSIVSWAYAETPDKIVWAVRDDGVLLSLTYLIEQDIYAWAEHSSIGGAFRSVAVITEAVGGLVEDVPYFVVVRTVAGRQIVAIERMHTRTLGLGNNDVTLAWHSDCALQYFNDAAPVTTFSGLDHLEGSTVAYLADGLPGTATVQGGVITLPTAASRVTAGVPMSSTFKTLPLDSSSPATDPMMGRLKHGYRARVALENTAGLIATVDAAQGTTFFDPTDDPAVPEYPPGMYTGVLETRLAEGWTRNGQLTLAANGPLPATILGIAIEWEAGE